MRAHEHLPAGLWDEDRQVDAVLLDFDERHRRRIRLPTVSGAAVLIDLPHTVRLREGDGLRLEDGGIVRVRAAPEPLLELTAATPAALLRLAWHLGNRHLPVQLAPDRLLIREDAVIAAMARGLGATVCPVHAPFEPEGGAYEPAGAPHGHAHGIPPHGEHPPHGHETPSQGAPSQEAPSQGARVIALPVASAHAHGAHPHTPHPHTPHVHGPHAHAADVHDDPPDHAHGAPDAPRDPPPHG